MRKRTIALRRAKCLFVYWRDGQLFFHNFVIRSTVAGRPVTCEVLHFFETWRTRQAAIAHFAHYTRSSVRLAVAQLVKHRLLLRKDFPEEIQDARIANEWSAWLPQGSFHFSTKDTPYVDRSKLEPGAFEAVLPKTPDLTFSKTVKGQQSVAAKMRVS